MLPNFGWLLPGELAGMAHPAEGRPSGSGGGLLERRLDELVDEGIGAVVSLTEEPLDRVAMARRSLRYLHLEVADMTAPDADELDRAVGFLDRAREDGLKSVVHCRAGLGRTGTLLACYLVSRGLSPSAAIAEVRRRRPGSVETEAQELAVHKYGIHYGARKRA
ncbi:MAG: dual specificity protein phosphatase family protein [Gemmatimonadota bacterium]